MSPQKNDKGNKEREYQRLFLDFVETSACPDYLADSLFMREVPLSYEQDKKRFSKSFEMPDYSLDFLEFDRRGGLHIWEAKWIHDSDLIRGKVIGQLMLYDYLFSTTKGSRIAHTLAKKGAPQEIVEYLGASQNLSITTWNILVCGGKGWELAAGVNPIMWLYGYIQGSYLHPDRQINLFHFTHINGRYVLKTIWELSLLYPHFWDTDVYLDFFAETGIDRSWWEHEMEGLRNKLAPSFEENLYSENFIPKMLNRDRPPPEFAIMDRKTRELFTQIASVVRRLIQAKDDVGFWDRLTRNEYNGPEVDD
jgi:hypothetical protein